MTGQALNQFVVETLEEGKALNIETLDVTGRSSLADTYIVASGTSAIHVRSLAERVEEALEEKGIKPRSIEGLDTRKWVLMDYGDLLVHLFLPEERAYYDIERLWQISTAR